MKEVFEKIIERLEEELEYSSTHGKDVKFREGRLSGLRTGMRIVNQVAEEYGTGINVGSNDGWNPVSERLPEIRDRYLCQIERTSYSYMDILYFSKNLEEVDEYDFMGKKYAGFYSYDSEYGHCEYEGVIAWRPLPEKYQPKGEK